VAIRKRITDCYSGNPITAAANPTRLGISPTMAREKKFILHRSSHRGLRRGDRSGAGQVLREQDLLGRWWRGSFPAWDLRVMAGLDSPLPSPSRNTYMPLARIGARLAKAAVSQGAEHAPFLCGGVFGRIPNTAGATPVLPAHGVEWQATQHDLPCARRPSWACLCRDGHESSPPTSRTAGTGGLAD
jgi:hypothetical protein